VDMWLHATTDARPSFLYDERGEGFGYSIKDRRILCPCGHTPQRMLVLCFHMMCGGVGYFIKDRRIWIEDLV
jgi:hypothetical protein